MSKDFGKWLKVEEVIQETDLQLAKESLVEDIVSEVLSILYSKSHLNEILDPEKKDHLKNLADIIINYNDPKSEDKVDQMTYEKTYGEFSNELHDLLSQIVRNKTRDPRINKDEIIGDTFVKLMEKMTKPRMTKQVNGQEVDKLFSVRDIEALAQTYATNARNDLFKQKGGTVIGPPAGRNATKTLDITRMNPDMKRMLSQPCFWCKGKGSTQEGLCKICNGEKEIFRWILPCKQCQGVGCSKCKNTGKEENPAMKRKMMAQNIDSLSTKVTPLSALGAGDDGGEIQGAGFSGASRHGQSMAKPNKDLPGNSVYFPDLDTNTEPDAKPKHGTESIVDALRELHNQPSRNHESGFSTNQLTVWAFALRYGIKNKVANWANLPVVSSGVKAHNELKEKEIVSILGKFLSEQSGREIELSRGGVTTFIRRARLFIKNKMEQSPTPTLPENTEHKNLEINFRKKIKMRR